MMRQSRIKSKELAWTPILTTNYAASLVDEIIQIDDHTSFNLARRLAREEGILVGGSSGTALGAALSYGKQLTSSDVIVVLLPDTGRGYLSKQFNDTWMCENGMFEKNDDVSSLITSEF
jgi:cystathionine beta-synthase